jgi:hypothetical protein
MASLVSKVRGEFNEETGNQVNNGSGQLSQTSSTPSSNSQSPSVVTISKNGSQSNSMLGGNNSSSSSLTGNSSNDTSNTWSSSAQKLARITNKIVDSISTPKSSHRQIINNPTRPTVYVDNLNNNNSNQATNGTSNNQDQRSLKETQYIFRGTSNLAHILFEHSF